MRSMDWTLEDNMVNGLFCATLTGCRGSHTPFVHTRAETLDTGTEAVKPDPGSSWGSLQKGMPVLQPLQWCCVDCVIHHERDVREE